MPYSTTILADSPLGYWRLNESTGATQFADDSGNNRPATIVGTPTYTTARYVDVGSVQLSGTQYGTVATGAWFSLMTSYSAEAWFATTTTGLRALVMYDNTGASPGNATRVFQLYLSGGQVIFIPLMASGAYVVVSSTGTAYNDGLWHHAVATWDGATAKVYVDGTLAGSAAISGTTTTGGGWPILIGTGANNTPGNLYQYSGYLDEVAVYGTALTSTQISTHYAAATPVLPASSAQVESSYVEVLAGGLPNARVESSYVEVLAGGLPSARIEASYLEILTNTPTIQTEAVYAEVLATGAPLLRTEGVYTEVLAGGTPMLQTEVIYAEVLVSVIGRRKGWGILV